MILISLTIWQFWVDYKTIAITSWEAKMHKGIHNKIRRPVFQHSIMLPCQTVFPGNISHKYFPKSAKTEKIGIFKHVK